MDQQTAQVLFKEGATFIFLDVSVNTEFGIDYNSWQVGPNFRGVKMIPPGIHFVYFSACNKEGQTAPRSGFFHNFQPREIVVRKWDKLTEDMTSEGVTADDMERFSSNMQDLDRFLGPYPYENYKKWVSMTNHISNTVLEHVLPDNGMVHSVTQFESKASTSQSRKRDREQQSMETDSTENASNNVSAAEDSEMKFLPRMTVLPGTSIRYSNITKRRYPPGATPAEVTRYSMDSSFLLETILNDWYSDSSLGILGEIQFAFICFLIGQNYDSFEQWKKLVHVLCTSEEALSVHTELFLQLVTVLHFQIRDIPEDFFVDIVSQNNFLTTTLQEFFSNLQSNPVDSNLKRKGLKFCDHLTEKFKWDFMTEPEDYAPVVVETE
ncbi:protein AAR2 homolog [Haliotis rubra]|uniref:protein AAR2 homolog n=1 Tax=Haliotis rubra TaxID=36100 RepID=UPI001EE62BBA|nr:protein AAR2 homolog [Haliotis rubra]